MQTTTDTPNTDRLYRHRGQLVYLGESFRNLANVYVLEAATWRPCRVSELRPIGGAR